MSGESSPLEILGRFNVRLADDVIRQRVDEAIDDDNIAACQFAVDCRSTDSARELDIAGNQTLDAARTAVDEDQLHVESLLLKQTRFLGDPVGSGRSR
ncbi:hypothetical protein D3C83_70730 [compost metagenome]